MATRVMQSDPYPQNGHFFQEMLVVIYLLATDQDCQLLHAFLYPLPQLLCWDCFLVLSQDSKRSKPFIFAKIWAQDGPDRIAP